MSKISIIILVVISTLLYALTLRGVYGNLDATQIKDRYDTVTMPFELSPERGRFVLTYSLAERNSFALDEKLANSADPDVGYYNGKYYIYFGPAISTMAVPFYNFGKQYNLSQVAAFSVISLFALGNILMVYFIGRNILKLPIGASFLAAIIFGFASTSWNYAITMYQHHTTTFFILSTLYAAWAYYAKGGIKSWLLAAYIWAAYGLSIFIDYPNLVLMFPVIVYFGYKSIHWEEVKKKINVSFNLIFILTSVFAIFFIFLQGYYNYVHFGDWKKLSGELIGIRDVRKINKTPIKKSTDKAKELANAASEKKASDFIKEVNTAISFPTLTVAGDKGIFVFSPIFILALLGIYAALKKINAEHVVLLGIVAANFFLYSSWADPWGGWAFGPRYLVPTMAIFSLYVVYWLHTTKYRILPRILTFTLFVISSAISAVGALTTNQVPPKVEADVLKIGYNFMLNAHYLLQGKTSSFIYKTYLNSYLSLNEFYVLIVGALIVVGASVLFFTMSFTKHEH